MKSILIEDHGTVQTSSVCSSPFDFMVLVFVVWHILQDFVKIVEAGMAGSLGSITSKPPSVGSLPGRIQKEEAKVWDWGCVKSRP